MNIRIFFLWLLDILGINALLSRLNRRKVLILWYHGICDDSFTQLKGYDDRFITRSSFMKQMEYLKNKSYNLITMTELINTIKNNGEFNKNVVLTFDDGLKNVIKNAYPIMQEYNAKGCLYVVSDNTEMDTLIWSDHVETLINSQKPGEFLFFFKGKKYTYILSDMKSYEYAIKDIKKKLRSITNKEMQEHLKQFTQVEKENLPEEYTLASWDELKELDAEILEIGSHTRTHPNCANLTDDVELENEILHSKEEIENIIGRKVEHFCYPAGSYNRRVLDEVKASGYQSAVTIEYGFIDKHADLYRLKRVEALASLPIFKSRVSGAYGILRAFSQIFRRRSFRIE